ncbi:MAG: hypothetical protein AAF514_16170 [Verrucomicrobiota bacterium]
MHAATKGTYFFYGILAVTLVPLVTLPIMAVASFPFDQSLLLGLAIFAGGVGHVASTACVYADSNVREVMRPMKGRFYVLPIVCTLLTIGAIIWGSSLSIAKPIVAGVFIFHLFWLHFHYQKQNYGLIAFVAASQGARVPRSLSNLLLFPALAGVLAVMPALVRAAMQDETMIAHLQPFLYATAVVVYLLGGALIGMVILKNRTGFSHPRTAVMTAASFLFFLPPVVLNHSDYAFWSYAIAHGFQYLLMVFTMAGGTRPSLTIVIAFVASVVGGGFFLHRLAGNQALFLCGILLTWVHFILDAKLWRMSEPGPRKLLRGRFSFLFPKT